MRPEQTAEKYDRIASWWKEHMRNSEYGVSQLRRAIQFTKSKGFALDIGCGSEGRFIDIMLQSNFDPETLKFLNSEMRLGSA